MSPGTPVIKFLSGCTQNSWKGFSIPSDVRNETDNTKPQLEIKDGSLGKKKAIRVA